MDSAGGRWRVGYWNPCSETENQDVNREFFKSMNGTRHSSERRTAGEAWNTGTSSGYTANTRMKGNDWTTLCPAPMLNNRWFPSNSDAVPGKRMGYGCVIFDTFMNDDFSADEVLKRESGSDIYNVRWGGIQEEWLFFSWLKEFHVGFDYDNVKGSGGKIKVYGEKSRNEDDDGGRGLDADRIAPNSDVNHENIDNWNY